MLEWLCVHPAHPHPPHPSLLRQIYEHSSRQGSRPGAAQFCFPPVGMSADSCETVCEAGAHPVLSPSERTSPGTLRKHSVCTGAHLARSLRTETIRVPLPPLRSAGDGTEQSMEGLLLLALRPLWLALRPPCEAAVWVQRSQEARDQLAGEKRADSRSRA